MRGRHDLVRALIDFMEAPLANLITSHFHSVMSFVGHEYKKHKELVESPQDFYTPDTPLSDLIH